MRDSLWATGLGAVVTAGCVWALVDGLRNGRLGINHALQADRDRNAIAFWLTVAFWVCITVMGVLVTVQGILGLQKT
jgi:hypothetical protein